MLPLQVPGTGMMDKQREFLAIDVSHDLEELPGLQVWGHCGKEKEEEERWVLLPVLLVAADGHFISWTPPKIWENLAWKCAERRLHQVVSGPDGITWLGWD